ncbi:spermidine export protein MdtI [Propionispira arboris]|uniref:Spermidine export protein MdtI n=1 Tax=Propionispira arboris TaxID=84035 RepID=A0A1H7D6G8_9FIRM|nr:SMR family transporter [Propionispira arboris]SEJ96924.1 spermidine export protein MdtI [Propionispira arboris]
MNNEMLFLSLSILLDVAANIFLKKSNGFRQKLWGLAAIVSILLAFIAFSQVIKTMDLSIAYAFWGAAGLILTTFVDMTFYGLRLKNSAIAGIACMITGIVLIKYVA